MADTSLSRGQNEYAQKKVTPKNRLRLQVRVGLTVAVGLTAAAAVWTAGKAYTISSHLQAATELAPALKASIVEHDPDAAAKTVAVLIEHTGQARQAAEDPLWTLASALPWVGQNFQAISTIATSADEVAKDAALPLVSVLKTMDWERLTPNAEGVDVAPLRAAEPKLSASSFVVSQSSERLDRLDATTLLPEVSAPLVTAREQLTQLKQGLSAAADIAKTAPEMMGASQKREYLLLIQNNAESRATGGIPGALAVMELDNGRFTLTAQTSASGLGAMSPTLPVDPEQQRIYSGRMGKFMQDVNLTPDFPTAAATAVAMWEHKVGDRLDGAISIDPVALSYLLNASGPVRVNPDVQAAMGEKLPAELTSRNVVKTLLSDVYAAVPDPRLQDAYFAGVAKELFGALAEGKGNAAALVDGVIRGAAEGRIMVWSAVHSEQAIVAKYSVGGSIVGPSISPSQFGVYFNDGTGAKMDYYVKRTVQLVEECPKGGYGQVKVRVTSTNTAPKEAAASLPDYVTGGGAFGVPAGTVQTNIVAYGPVQSNVEKAAADGKKISFASQLHSGRPLGTVTVTLPPGKSSTVEFTFGKIVQHTEPKLSVTPTVQPLDDVVLKRITETCTSAG